MSELATITIKIPKELKKRIEKLKIDVDSFICEILEREIAKREERELQNMAEELQKILRKAPRDEWIKAIRESREE